MVEWRYTPLFLASAIIELSGRLLTPAVLLPGIGYEAGCGEEKTLTLPGNRTRDVQRVARSEIPQVVIL
jgi:hypothetical protein